MNIGKILAITGGIIATFGMIFHLQGLSIVGPETSFMYSNPNWITYGIQIFTIGAIMSILGLVIWIKTKQ